MPDWIATPMGVSDERLKPVAAVCAIVWEAWVEARFEIELLRRLDSVWILAGWFLRPILACTAQTI